MAAYIRFGADKNRRLFLALALVVCVFVQHFAAFAILHPNEPFIVLSALVCVHFRGQIGWLAALRLVLHVIVMAALDV